MPEELLDFRMCLYIYIYIYIYTYAFDQLVKVMFAKN